MKQLLFMTVLTGIGVTGAVVHAFWGVLLYYTYAVLRPQYLWEWSLPAGVRWSLIAAGAAVVGVVLNLPRILSRARWNPVATLIVVFGTLLLMSTLSAVDPDVAAKWGVEYAKIFTMAILATLVIDHLRHIRHLAVMILLCTGYVAYEINSLYVFDGRLDIFHYGYGGLDNNGAGLMLAMGLPFAYAFFRHASSVMVRVGCALVSLLMIHAVLMSYSRGAMLSAIVAGLWLLWHHRPRRHAAIIAAVVMMLTGVMAGKEIRDRFLSIQQYQQDGSSQSRIESWSAAWRMTWDHPLTGVGIRNSNLLSYNYGADVYGRTIHSQYLQVAADCGVPAMIVYVTLCVTAVRRMRRLRREIDAQQPSHGEPGGLDAAQGDEADRDKPRPVTDPLYGTLALAVETSLITFCFGGLFLSLEVFELPWLLFAMAGALPVAVRHHEHDHAAAHEQHELAAERKSAMALSI